MTVAARGWEPWQIYKYEVFVRSSYIVTGDFTGESEQDVECGALPVFRAVSGKAWQIDRCMSCGVMCSPPMDDRPSDRFVEADFEGYDGPEPMVWEDAEDEKHDPIYVEEGVACPPGTRRFRACGGGAYCGHLMTAPK